MGEFWTNLHVGKSGRGRVWPLDEFLHERVWRRGQVWTWASLDVGEFGTGRRQVWTWVRLAELWTLASLHMGEFGRGRVSTWAS